MANRFASRGELLLSLALEKKKSKSCMGTYKSDTETKTNANEGDHNISSLLTNVNEIMHAYPPMSVLDSSLHEPVRMVFSDEEGSMSATDEYFRRGVDMMKKKDILSKLCPRMIPNRRKFLGKLRCNRKCSRFNQWRWWRGSCLRATKCVH